MASDPVPTFGVLLRSFRLAAGLTQEALAERAGLSVRGISNLESGSRRLPHPHTVRQLARALRLPAADRAQLEAARPRRAAAEPVPPAPAPPTILPAALTSFVGRELEMAEIGRLLATTRLLTLTGTGGCGKTRLALQAAAEAVDAYPDGVWLAELAPLADAGGVPAAAAAALGVRGGPGQPIQAALLSFLRARRLLLLLDNCEHLLDACARLADALLRGCPGVRILATSREALGIAGETAWRVPSLALPPAEPAAALAAIADAEAVRLFVERAAAVAPGFALTERNARAVAQICARLDGIPLAIELAATRVGSLPMDQIVGRLDRGFRLLTGGNRAALPRQQTLAATVGWSYDLLAAPERAVFDRLAVFAGGFALEAAEAVCGDEGDGEGGAPEPRPGAPVPRDDVLDLLGGLVAKSLVVAEGGAGGVEGYRLLETLRHYARERLVVAGEAERAHARHAAYYRRLALAAAPQFHRPEQLAALARLDRERENLRAALRWHADGGRAVAGLGLAEALTWWWWFRGLLPEGRAWLDRFLALPGASGPSPARVRALSWAGAWAVLQGDPATGHRQHAEAIATARRLGDDGALAWALLFATRNDEPESERWYGASAHGLAEEALARYRAAGVGWGVADALTRLGTLASQRGEPDRARWLLTEGLAAARAAGDRWCVAIALEYLGAHTSAADDAAAGAQLSESLRCYRELGDLVGVAHVENLLGHRDCLHGRAARAGGHYRASLRLTKDWAWMLKITESLDGLARVAAEQGHPERALRLSGASARLREAAGDLAPPREQAALERSLASARAAVGAAAALDAWAEGRAMTLEAAVAEALAGEEAGDG